MTDRGTPSERHTQDKTVSTHYILGSRMNKSWNAAGAKAKRGSILHCWMIRHKVVWQPMTWIILHIEIRREKASPDPHEPHHVFIHPRGSWRPLHSFVRVSPWRKTRLDGNLRSRVEAPELNSWGGQTQYAKDEQMRINIETHCRGLLLLQGILGLFCDLPPLLWTASKGGYWEGRVQ